MNDLSIFEHMAIDAVSDLDTSFDALAAGAAACVQYGGSFGIYIFHKGAWTFEDVHDTLEDAAGDMADKWPEWEAVAVREYAPSGKSVDVTKDAMKIVEIAECARGELAPWEEPVEDDGLSDHERQRSVAMNMGHFA